MAIKNVKKKTKSVGGKNKRAGSSFEREVAKLLSIWIYGREAVIRRHPTSGSEKEYGQGADVTMFQPGFDEFKYFVEVKRGYKTDIFNARKQFLEWYNIAKIKNKKKYPIWIIWKVLRQGMLLASTIKLKLVKELFIIDDLFIYDFKEVLQYEYKKIVSNK